MSLATYTAVHVAISLIAIASGLAVLYGMLQAKSLNGTTALFLTTTVLTSVTGFGFPFTGITPAIKVGIISLVLLAVSISARYPLRMSGIWRKTYVISALTALYLNVFVLVVQSFEKVPALKAAAPTQKEAPFVAAQIAVFAGFVVLTYLAAKRFRAGAVTLVKSVAKAA
jgi:hypothetical protein